LPELSLEILKSLFLMKQLVPWMRTPRRKFKMLSTKSCRIELLLSLLTDLVLWRSALVLQLYKMEESLNRAQ
jgi:hypothetical protein